MATYRTASEAETIAPWKRLASELPARGVVLGVTTYRRVSEAETIALEERLGRASCRYAA